MLDEDRIQQRRVQAAGNQEVEQRGSSQPLCCREWPATDTESLSGG